MDSKRIFDVVLAGAGFLLATPVLLLVAAAIFAYDFHNPLYIAPRIGRAGRPFRMVKFRSMVVAADRTGVTSTSAADPRVTPIGHLIRRFKLDELIQLWNVIRGDMSLVGPRPNVPSGVALYTQVERGLLSIRPGITDFASIVFADEGDILKDELDPDLAYNQLIRPWKSRLGLLYIDTRSTLLDLKLVWLTAVAIASRERALTGVHGLLRMLGAAEDLATVALRRAALVPTAPPGMSHIVTARA